MRNERNDRTPADLRRTVLAVVSDMVTDFLYYDRKESESLPRGAIEQLIADGHLTVDDIVTCFRENLEAGVAGPVERRKGGR